ncbi:unnamed protein product [marine sediment metagenome]|uniref:Uncharacterized protein n=1 Tax=marine sediment metagenome TaxID=412755 RepID=X1DEM6_9ZZZZ
MQKEWWKSTANWGAIFVALGMIFTAIGKVLLGEMDTTVAIPIIVAAIGVILVITGLRKRLPDAKP